MVFMMRERDCKPNNEVNASCARTETGTIEWHPYPDEKPSMRGIYLTAVPIDGTASVKFLVGYFLDTRFFMDNERIVAWAKCPDSKAKLSVGKWCRISKKMIEYM